jgi:hypothetical protein
VNKSRFYRWAGLLIGTGVVALETGSCVLQDFVDSILGVITGS